MYTFILYSFLYFYFSIYYFYTSAVSSLFTLGFGVCVRAPRVTLLVLWRPVLGSASCLGLGCPVRQWLGDCGAGGAGAQIDWMVTPQSTGGGSRFFFIWLPFVSVYYIMKGLSNYFIACLGNGVFVLHCFMLCTAP